MPHFDSQNPAAWGWGWGSAADLVPFTYRGHNFPHGVARGTDRLFTAALERICAQPGFTLPPSLGLDAGMWGYAARAKRGSQSRSFHGYGLALDIAAPWNPMRAAEPPPGPHRLPANTDELVRPLGLRWGGTFGDWMHVECHLSPAEVAEWALPGGSLGGNSPPEACPLMPGEYFGPRSGPAQSISNMVRPRPAYVAALQRVQRALGVPADGLYGPQTAAAARAYQLSHGLSADGLIGRRTWFRLFGE